MTVVIVISILTCAGMIVSVLVKPSVKIKNYNLGLYWVIVLLGAVIILCSGLLPFDELIEGLTANTAINPLKILVLFISMTVLSIFLDEVGLFKYLANEAVKHAKGSQRLLFLYLYLMVSLLTVFTSNDIIVLTFTPFICYFAKNADVDPVPYLVGEFVAANTFSMTLIIGNPTNIYLASAAGIGFVEYLKVMLVPSLFAGVTAYAVLNLLFMKKLSGEMHASADEVEITDKPLMIISVTLLAVCTVLLAVSSYIGLEMWYISLGAAVLLLVIVLVFKLIKKEKPTELVACLKRAPWELIPFVLSMFVIVLALEKQGVTKLLADFLGDGYTILKYGFSSMLFANLINNIPMSVLFSSVVGYLPAESYLSAVYATVAGSNIGAFLTPVGALAGIMWSGILKSKGVKFTFARFILYGFIVAIPVMFAALGGLYLMLGA